METFTYGEESPAMGLSARALSIIEETSKWTRFLAIAGYIFVGLMVLLAIALFGMGGMIDPGSLGSLQGGMMGFLYLLMALLYFFPVHYLFLFSSRMREALRQSDAITLEAGFDYLRKHYKFIGILTIIMLGFYVLMLVFGVIAGVMAAAFA